MFDRVLKVNGANSTLSNSPLRQNGVITILFLQVFSSVTSELPRSLPKNSLDKSPKERKTIRTKMTLTQTLWTMWNPLEKQQTGIRILKGSRFGSRSQEVQHQVWRIKREIWGKSDVWRLWHLSPQSTRWELLPSSKYSMIDPHFLHPLCFSFHLSTWFQTLLLLAFLRRSFNSSSLSFSSSFFRPTTFATEPEETLSETHNQKPSHIQNSLSLLISSSFFFSLIVWMVGDPDPKERPKIITILLLIPKDFFLSCFPNQTPQTPFPDPLIMLFHFHLFSISSIPPLSDHLVIHP